MSRSFENLKFHTTKFTKKQLADVIGAIVERVADDYPEKRIDLERLTKGLYAAHRAKPIRLIALLNSCATDFPKDVIMGVYRHYDPATDSIKNGWTAQHAEPDGEPDDDEFITFLNALFGSEEDSDEYDDYHSTY